MSGQTLQPIPALLDYTGAPNPLVVEVFYVGRGWTRQARGVPATYDLLSVLRANGATMIGVRYVRDGQDRGADFSLSELMMGGMRACGDQARAERALADEARYSIVGAYSGRTFAESVSRDEVVKWMADYRRDGVRPDPMSGHGRDVRPALEIVGTMAVGSEWRSHRDARGIVVRRTS